MHEEEIIYVAMQDKGRRRKAFVKRRQTYCDQGSHGRGRRMLN